MRVDEKKSVTKDMRHGQGSQFLKEAMKNALGRPFGRCRVGRGRLGAFLSTASKTVREIIQSNTDMGKIGEMNKILKMTRKTQFTRKSKLAYTAALERKF